MQQNLYQNPTFPQGIMSSNHPPDGNTWSSVGTFSTPVSEAIYVTTATSTWAHTVPPFMPWVPDGCTTTISEPIVRFTAPFPPDPCTSKTATTWELMNNISLGRANTNVHLKRRLDAEEPAILPQKQLVTEEKMAARMQNLHISNEYTSSHVAAPLNACNGENKSISTIQELQVMLSANESKEDNAFNKSLILAPEIKSLVDPEKLFAKTFVNEVERPTMAVVLWKPPHGDIKKIINSSRQLTTSDSENNVFMSASLEETNNENASDPQSKKCEPLSCLPIDFGPVIFTTDDFEDYEMEA